MTARKDAPTTPPDPASDPAAVHDELTSRLVDLHARNVLNVHAIWRLAGHGEVNVSMGLRSVPPDRMDAPVEWPSTEGSPLRSAGLCRLDGAPAPLEAQWATMLLHNTGGITTLPPELSLLLEPALKLHRTGVHWSLTFIVPFQASTWGKAMAAALTDAWFPPVAVNVHGQAVHNNLQLNFTGRDERTTLSEGLMLTDGSLNYRHCTLNPDMQDTLRPLLHRVNRQYQQDTLPRLAGHGPHDNPPGP